MNAGAALVVAGSAEELKARRRRAPPRNRSIPAKAEARLDRLIVVSNDG